ncbi:hypothetical protein MKEN_00422100 [Mycena kentingensis (nom. inval.)]|nr:hypothetical protein MKEN_00422100 [Mycena kentingensis (nom. inval.)]
MQSARSSFTLHEPESNDVLHDHGCQLPPAACLHHHHGIVLAGNCKKYANFSPPPSCPTLNNHPTDAHDPDDWFCDPRNPRNWPRSRKWLTTAVVALYMFVSPLSSSMMAPGQAQIATRYGIKNESILAMTLSIFLLSFGLGPLVLAPVSVRPPAFFVLACIIYTERRYLGNVWKVRMRFPAEHSLSTPCSLRKWVLHIGILFSVLFHLGCAFAPTTAALLAFRFLAGLSGSAPVSCGGAVVSDLFDERERASAMALYSLGPLLGPVVGPIAGGFIAQTVGVQYVYFALAGITSLVGLIGLPFLQRASRFSAIVTRNLSGKLSFLWSNFSRPVYLLTHSFICFTLSLYMAFLYGIYYLFFVTFNGFFTSTYRLTTGEAGLMYTGLGAGFVLATSCGAKFSNILYTYLADRNGGKGEPEMRIPPIFFGSVWVPIGLLWYGWSAEQKLHWIMPVVGSSIFGFGMMVSFLPIQLYLVDSFKYAASALSAAFLFRSLLGFSFPLFGHEIFEKLGYGWGFSLLAGELLHRPRDTLPDFHLLPRGCHSRKERPQPLNSSGRGRG